MSTGRLATYLHVLTGLSAETTAYKDILMEMIRMSIKASGFSAVATLLFLLSSFFFFGLILKL